MKSGKIVKRLEFFSQSDFKCFISELFFVLVKSVNSTCVQPPPPPGNRGAFASLVSTGGGALANLAGAGHWPTPGAPLGFDTHVVNFKTWSTWRIPEIKISSLWRIGLSSKGQKNLPTILKVCFLNFNMYCNLKSHNFKANSESVSIGLQLLPTHSTQFATFEFQKT